MTRDEATGLLQEAYPDVVWGIFDDEAGDLYVIAINGIAYATLPLYKTDLLSPLLMLVKANRIMAMMTAESRRAEQEG